ncbi:hypothetical protein GCM10010348_00950 [Streptomyces anthocyanicus]|nr:hypothetical protein GCM10010348_00950 [Streptomyces anthocyanicus]
MVLQAAAWAGGIAVLALWWRDTGAVVGAAGWLTGAGRITGLLCGYMCALLVALMARVPWLESRVGSDRAARWHASAGRWTIGLLLAHVLLIVLGYAAQAQVAVVRELGTIVFDLPEMLKATAGALILLAVGYTSARAVRRRMRYETWYHLHLFTYAAVFLGFSHQLALGADFVSNAPARAAWYALYLSVACLVLYFRVLTPVRLNLRHRIRVEAVVPEGPGVHSVWMRGRRLDRLDARPGQFLRWRFLTPGMRGASHPYSLSAVPRDDLMRITVKTLGDHSAAVAALRPGTRVWAEGPYGALTAARRSRRKVLLVAGGHRDHPAAHAVRDAARRARRPDAALPGAQPGGTGAERRTGSRRRRTRRPPRVRPQRPGRIARPDHRATAQGDRAGRRPARRVPVRTEGSVPGRVRRPAGSRGARVPHPPRVLRTVSPAMRAHPVRRTALTCAATVTVTVLVLSLKPHHPPAGALPPATTPTPSSGTGTGGTSSGTRTVTGPAVQTRYGAVQVQLTLDGSRIVAARAVQSPGGDPRSRQINASAVPALIRETLNAQSAHLDTVSGATYTSEGYIGSLQSALDRTRA